MRLSLPIIAVVFGVVLGGCSGGPGPGEATLEVGSGEWRFEPITDGQDVELVHGSQGGWHVWLSMEAQGLDPRRIETEIVMTLPDDPTYMDRSVIFLDFQEGDDPDTVRFIGWPSIFSRPACVAGREVMLDVTLTDRDGAIATDSCAVVPVPMTGDPGPCE